MNNDIKNDDAKNGNGSGRKSIGELKKLAETAIEEYFEGIDDVIDKIIYKIAEENKIENDDDINFLKKKIMRGILKMDG